MKSQKDVDRIFHATLADRNLSRSERRALKEILDDLDPSPNQLAFLRHRAFAVARGAISNAADGRQVVEWLEEIVKLLVPRPEDEPIGTTARARFSPGSECRDQIETLLESARRSADICVFTITDDRLSRAIVDAHRRGVRVRVISDDDKAFDRGSDVHRLRDSGVQVRVDKTDKHMHHKFALFDHTTLLTGSYNWTRSAFKENEENIIVVDDPRLVSAFSEEFASLWKMFET